MAAQFTGISLQELERLRRVGGGAPFCHVSARLIRYAITDLQAWLNSFKVCNTSEAIERQRSAARKAVARG